MAAKDYKICPAAYIAKVSKNNPNLMTDDRREITEEEILLLIDWWLDMKCEEGEQDQHFNSRIREGYNVVIEFKKSAKRQEKED